MNRKQIKELVNDTIYTVKDILELLTELDLKPKDIKYEEMEKIIDQLLKDGDVIEFEDKEYNSYIMINNEYIKEFQKEKELDFIQEQLEYNISKSLIDGIMFAIDISDFINYYGREYYHTFSGEGKEYLWKDYSIYKR